MAWYDEAVFYHIYPLGLLGAPKQNPYGEVVHRLRKLFPWIEHIREIGCSAVYIGPLFESVGHGYETTDYRKLDSRLGDNEDLKDFVKKCHTEGLHVIFDGVFNHTGRDFFAFQDIRQNRENSPYRDWYCNVNFWGNNEYNDGFSYDNWGGYNLLAKLNQRNPQVQEYICDVIRFWVSEFDVDGIRLDAADVLDFGFMQTLRKLSDTVKPEFWLMGEVIHGEYSRWVNPGMLHSVTNYHLQKALYSGHNDHNYFEIAHTVRRLNDMGVRKLYNFVDNHDVERIYTRLANKSHFVPVHILLYTLPGIPSVYYGSEFGIEGRKVRGGPDDEIRPALQLVPKDHSPAENAVPSEGKTAVSWNWCTDVIARLGRIRQQEKALSYGSYTEHLLTTRQFAFSRSFEGRTVLIAVNNDENTAHVSLPAEGRAYLGVLSGRTTAVVNGRLEADIPAGSGEVWIPAEETKGTAVCSGPESEEAELPKESRKAGNQAVLDLKADVQTTGNHAVVDQKKETRTAENQAAVDQKAEAQAAGNRKAEDQGQEEQAAGSQPDGDQEPEKQMPSGQAAEKQKTEAQTVEEQKPSENASPVVIPESVRNPAAAGTGRSLEDVPLPADKPYEEMTVPELQKIIYEKMKKNGPLNDRMYQDIIENNHHGSLINWAKSFR
ncbi:MAG: alpha-amylase [Blautia sp.]|nr:alpha-amylase [Blautia sp.]